MEKRVYTPFHGKHKTEKATTVSRFKQFVCESNNSCFNNKKFLDYLKEIYPSQLTVEKANKSDHLAHYLNLTFIIDREGRLSTRLYDKRDDFDFHIVNFPFLSCNIPSGPSYTFRSS